MKEKTRLKANERPRKKILKKGVKMDMSDKIETE